MASLARVLLQQRAARAMVLRVEVRGAASTSKKAINNALARAAVGTTRGKNEAAPVTTNNGPARPVAPTQAAPALATAASAAAMAPINAVTPTAPASAASAPAPAATPTPAAAKPAAPAAKPAPAPAASRPTPTPAWTEGGGVARVYYENENPKLVLDMPTANACVFSLSMGRDVNYLLLQIQDEDPSITPLPILYDTDGHRIARSTLLADALRPGVALVFNGVRHPVVLPTLEERTLPLRSELGSLQTDFDKLQELKNVCDKAAESHATRLMWGGFFGLCAQWGLMMRLTWYEYSWDVMEPISYFISFGTGILGYMFYVITRKDYTFENLGGTTTNRRQRLEYRKRGLDLDKYVRLQTAINGIESQLDAIKRDYATAKP